tara:strand:- start:521 stop:739 length:219 start_codon:yes stop_codon:yes gene_type:complete
MKNMKKINTMLIRNQIISSVVWATVILACSLSSVNTSKEITYILISGFFIEFLRISSTNKSLKKDIKEKGIK